MKIVRNAPAPLSAAFKVLDTAMMPDAALA